MTLSFLLIIPLIGAVLIALIPRDREELSKWLALAVSLLNLLVSLPLYFGFEARAGYQFEEFAAWIPSLNINYHVGIDGLSLFLVLLTTFLSIISILSSWTAITTQVKEYMALMLALETAMLGVFTSLDLFLFYLFWEASLIPMALLIGQWRPAAGLCLALNSSFIRWSAAPLTLVAARFQVLLGRAEYIGRADAVANANLPGHLAGVAFHRFCSWPLRSRPPCFLPYLAACRSRRSADGRFESSRPGVLLKMERILRFARHSAFPRRRAASGRRPWSASLAVAGILYGALVALMQE